MSNLPDNWKLSGVSIPGTHNTATNQKWSKCNTILDYCCQCQKWTIMEQLDQGIRFLDLRPAYDEKYNEIYLWHGHIDLGWLTLDDTLSIVSKFLSLAPKETVIINFNCQWGEKFCGNDFVRKFDDILQKYENLSQIFPVKPGDQSSPRLHEVRGKIVLFFKQYLDGIKSIREWNYKTMENTWEFEDWDAYYLRLVSNIREAMADNNGPLNKPECAQDTFYLTWLSANNCFARGGAWPSRIARFINSWMKRDLLGELGGEQGKWGIIIMDFPTNSLVHTIVHRNLGLMKNQSHVGCEPQK